MLKLGKIKKKGKKKKDLKISGVKCDYCEDILSGSIRIKRHYKAYHVNQPIILSDYERFYCNDCSDYFFAQLDLDKHKVLKHGIKIEGNEICKRCKQFYKENSVHKCTADYYKTLPKKVNRNSYD